MATQTGSNWETFVLKHPFNSTVQEIYDLWTSSSGMEKWFLRSARFFNSNDELRDASEPAQAGDKYSRLWHGYPDETFENGEVIEANGKDRFSFRFGEAGIVSVFIYKSGKETIVELRQEKIPVDEASKFNYHVGCSNGWTFYLANMRSIINGGIDIRNRNNELNMM